MPYVNEPNADLRVIDIFLEDLLGTGIAGQSKAAGATVELLKPGGSWTTSTNDLTDLLHGVYRLPCTLAEWNTPGSLWVRVARAGVITEYENPIVLEPQGDWLRYFQAGGGGASFVTLDANADSTHDNYYAGDGHNCVAVVVYGLGAGQARLCTGYTASTKRLAVTPDWKVALDSTSGVKLFAYTGQLDAATITAIQAGLATDAHVLAIPTTPVLADDARIAHLDVDLSTRLAPTVAGRTLNIAAGGQAGVNWADVAASTTAHDMSNTTVAGGGGGGGGGSAPTAAQNAAAVLAAILDSEAPAGCQTVQEILNILGAYLAGELGGLPSSSNGSFSYDSLSGHMVRLAGVIANGTRTVTTKVGT